MGKLCNALGLLAAMAVSLWPHDAVAQNAPLPSVAALPSASTTASTPNWVGPLKGKPIDNACYRKSYITKNKQCGTGYNFDKITTCWVQCPIEYPVECGMECLPQNEDCAKAVLRKVGSVVSVALNAATAGVFGELSKASKGVQQGVKCGQQLFNVVNKISAYVDEVENGGKANTTTDQLVFVLSKSDLVLVDLPAVVATCLDLPDPSGQQQTKQVLDVINMVVSKVVASKTGGSSAVSPDTLGQFATDVGLGKSITSLSSSDKATLKQLVSAGATCGGKIKAVIDKIVMAVKETKAASPTSSVDIIRFSILNSNLVLKDLPEATVGCVAANAPEGFKNRDQILKTVHLIIDKVVEASSQNGKPVSTADYAITIANMGLDAIALFDPTGLAKLAAEFIQPICGPTVYIGDIDDGPAEQAVGLTTVQKAFRNSTGSWVKTGDGQLRITFLSADDQNVRVNIKSGGKKLYEVAVKKGETVEWTKPLSEFQGKTLYMDRWRPGFLGLPGTGGGSFLSWVPNDSDGTLTLKVKINPTNFSDHTRRH